jgi:hypothetical protein
MLVLWYMYILNAAFCQHMVVFSQEYGFVPFFSAVVLGAASITRQSIRQARKGNLFLIELACGLRARWQWPGCSILVEAVAPT